MPIKLSISGSASLLGPANREPFQSSSIRLTQSPGCTHELNAEALVKDSEPLSWQQLL
jgi:hypothetical protein